MELIGLEASSLLPVLVGRSGKFNKNFNPKVPHERNFGCPAFIKLRARTDLTRDEIQAELWTCKMF